MPSDKTSPPSDNAQTHQQMIESDTQSFVLKLWVDSQDDDGNQRFWYGYITHVPSDERHHFKSFGELNALLMPYLQEMGIRPPPIWRLIPWLPL